MIVTEMIRIRITPAKLDIIINECISLVFRHVM